MYTCFTPWSYDRTWDTREYNMEANHYFFWGPTDQVAIQAIKDRFWHIK